MTISRPLIGFLGGLVLLGACTPAPGDQPIQTLPMAYDDCLTRIDAVTSRRGIEAGLLADTADQRAVRMVDEGEIVTVTCDRVPGQMTVTSAPLPEPGAVPAAGAAAPQAGLPGASPVAVASDPLSGATLSGAARPEDTLAAPSF
ncbi:hypothetical protein [Pseudoroseicyclus aestuarii]|uniref:Uncharacterized protein n=1 Tax=Pseudoroseicyclus aestuarii TaxID=1795041 RepID=A0A318T758_9RHOB|nr:hypothetical protein [Pseudoroseicyclus aestuarii]PYE84238.1 hypothetical protein DFP88_10233 [Pseudoroseicyclus aestuarii]